MANTSRTVETLAISPIPAEASPLERKFFTTVKSTLEVLTGVIGNAGSTAVTFKDLIDMGLDINSGFNTVSSDRPTYGTTGDTTPPGQPTGMMVAPVGMNSHRISWTNPSDSDLYFIQIYRGTVNDFGDPGTSLAYVVTVSLDEIGEDVYEDLSGHETNITYYYWLIAVDWSGNRSDVAFVGEALSTSNPSINAILADLQGDIKYSEISSQLQNATDISENIQTGVVFATNVNGNLSGLIHANDGSASTMYFVTDSFHIINPAGDEATIPFSVGTTQEGVDTVGINGQVIVNGTIAANAIETASITATQIDGGGFGTLTLTSGQLNIQASDGISITSGGSMSLAAGTDISMNAVTGNTAALNFYTGGSLTATLYGTTSGSLFTIQDPAGTHACAISFSAVEVTSQVGTTNIDGASGIALQYNSSTKMWITTSGISVTGNIVVSGTVDGYDIASTLGNLGTISTQNSNNVSITGGSVAISTISGLGTIATQNSNNVSITGGSIADAAITAISGSKISGAIDIGSSTIDCGFINSSTVTAPNIYITGSGLRPTTSGGSGVCGTSTYYWNSTHSDAYYDYGGGYNDDLDDLAILHAMKDNGKRDKNGRLILDILSLPDWATNKEVLKRDRKLDTGEDLSDEEFDNWIKDKNGGNNNLAQNVSAVLGLTNGGLRQLDIRVKAEIADILSRIEVIENSIT